MATKSLKERYKKESVEALKKRFNYENDFQVPKLEKVVLNMGLGEAAQNSKLLDVAAEEMTRISGQKAVKTKAKKSVAAFKVREGMPLGCMVTLRGERMYDFMQKLISVVLPRIRDFRGVSSKSFDGRGNYSLGLKEHILFPEINYDEVDMIKGMNISIVTTAETDEEAKALLEELGMPFRKPRQQQKSEES